MNGFARCCTFARLRARASEAARAMPSDDRAPVAPVRRHRLYLFERDEAIQLLRPDCYIIHRCGPGIARLTILHRNKSGRW
jgi:hypothetical protein